MDAAILCPGPTLARHDPRQWEDAGVVIAVNRAAEDFACDWWAVLDAEVFGNHLLAPPKTKRPRLLMFDISFDRLMSPGGEFSHLAGEMRKHQITRTSVLATMGPPQSWATYTACAALVLAAWIGAGRIDVYGADMEGDRDFKGDAGRRRDCKRWTQEREHWQLITQWLEGRNVRVERRVAA